MSSRSPWSRFAELRADRERDGVAGLVPRNAGRVNGMSNFRSVRRANSNDFVIEKKPRSSVKYARRKNWRIARDVEDGERVAAVREDVRASSSRRTFPSWSRSERLKKMSAVMPPSTPTVTTARESAAPTAIVALRVASGCSAPVAGSAALDEEALEQAGGVLRVDERGEPGVS